MARFLLAPFGSAGDVNPCVWLGRLLQGRGHEVTLITTPLFRALAEKAGLDFVAVGNEAEYRSLLSHPALWKPLVGTALVFKLAMKALRPFYEELAQRVRREDTVIVAPLSLLSARAVREKYRVPLVSMHLQPVALLSAQDQTRFLPGMGWVDRIPVWMKRLAYRMPNPLEWQASGHLRRFCAEIGIPHPRRIFPDWLHSPDANLLLFPEWFAPRQSDWPLHSTAAGFPLADLSDQFTLPLALEAFLSSGDKPILLSPGTGNAQARRFFEMGLAACQKLGRRALVGTTFLEQLPQPLASNTFAFDYLPFSKILPRVCAFVHHGGVGTLSQAFAEGVPQLIMPMSHDQPDNAWRARKLGVSEDLTVRNFTVENIAAALSRLLKSESVATACQKVAARMKEDRAAEVAMEVLEKAAREGVK